MVVGSAALTSISEKIRIDRVVSARYWSAIKQHPSAKKSPAGLRDEGTVWKGLALEAGREKDADL